MDAKQAAAVRKKEPLSWLETCLAHGKPRNRRQPEVRLHHVPMIYGLLDVIFLKELHAETSELPGHKPCSLPEHARSLPRGQENITLC